MPFKGSFLQIISFIMRFDFQKYSSPVSFVKKMSKELDSYEFYRYLFSTIQVLQLHVFVRAFFRTVASCMLFLIKAWKSSEMTLLA